jgi:hypothetical protein
MANLTSLQNKWGDEADGTLRDAINDLYNAIPNNVEVDPDFEGPQKASAYELASQFNLLKDVFDELRRVEPGVISDTVYSLSGNGGTAGQDDEYWPDSSSGFGSGDDRIEDYNDAAHVLLLIIENLNIIQENPLFFTDLDEGGDVDLESYFLVGSTPADAILTYVDTFKDKADEYLFLFPELSYSLKKEVSAIEDKTGELGPTTIFSDTNLEASLSAQDSNWPYTTQTHYIGLLAGTEGFFSGRFLPVRLQPQLSNTTNSQGWRDTFYSILDNDGDPISALDDSPNKISDGIRVPLGFEITITEIVPSETGIWVGFISSDPRVTDLDSSIFGEGILGAEQTKVLYTKAEYVRIKTGTAPFVQDPYLSERAKLGDVAAAEVRGIEGGAPLIARGQGENWVKLRPYDVKLQYYNFYVHNANTIGVREEEGISDGEGALFYNPQSLATYPSLRYSEGYFYFIVGAAPRKTEAELINESAEDLEISTSKLEAAKLDASAATHEEIREEAWSNLLNYLGKSTAGLDSNYVNQLKEKYFVSAAKKVNTATVDPNNEKILFAIRASYLDSLPGVRRPYTNNFEPDDPFLKGNNYAVAMKMADITPVCNNLKVTLRGLKSRIEKAQEAPGLRIENANGLIFDIKSLITAVDQLQIDLNEFFNRQSFPSSMNRSNIYELVRSGTDTEDSNHLIQIGVKDNGEIGRDVRETVSYILFSPSPESLKDEDKDDSDLFYFDPFLTEDELNEKTALKRSAIPLDIGLPWLREKLEGVYASRALHLLLSHEKFNSFTTNEKDKWMDVLSEFIVPPVRIYPSKDPSLITEKSTTECSEIIDRLNKSGPNPGIEERLLQQRLYKDKECAKLYFQQFAKDTPAVSPGTSKEELEKKSEKTQKGGNVLDNQYVKILYTGFFNNLDVESIIALIMACLQRKLGVAITAEAICEAAIIKLVESTGVDSVEKIMLANALLAPNSESSQLFLEVQGGAPPFAPKDYDQKGSATDKNADDGLFELDQSYNNAPIATSMLMSEKVSSLYLELDPAPGDDALTTKYAIADAIKTIEKSGAYVDLIPGKRPSGENEIEIPVGSALYNKLGVENYVAPETYTKLEIESERARLKAQGYTTNEANAVMVGLGYLVPNPQQYGPLLGQGAVGKYSQTPSPGASSGPHNYSAVDDARVVGQSAQDWLNYMKRTIGLSSLCELIVGDILDGVQDLLRDPGAFFNGGFKGWLRGFTEGLKRQFSPPVPTLKFPDSLSTDNHMGDYGEKLLKTILSMVAQMLGQIVNLLLTSVLEQCVEGDSDIGASGRLPESPPDIPLPVLSRASLPKFDNLTAPDVVAWMKDILDNVTTGQLCALLRGDATKQTLQGCLTRTRLFWPDVYNSGVDTIYEIRIAFEKIGADLDLNICNAVESPTLVNDLCEAVFDRDARCSALKQGGLTEQECQAQIDQEIADLRNKVAGLTGLSLLDINPLSNSLPPVCGDNGSFSIPPGVKDTMERITDNMLTNVKGSLMIDLAGLKFFSAPPRALLAVTDPEELKSAHKVFVDLAKNPNVKKCLAVIADPYNHSKSDNIPDGSFGIGSNLQYEVYPLTYNQEIHAGGLYTREEVVIGGDLVEAYESSTTKGYQDPITDQWWPEEDYDKIPEDVLQYVMEHETFSSEDYAEKVFGIGGSLEAQFALPKDKLKNNLELYLSTYTVGPDGTDSVFNSEELVPLHPGLLIATPSDLSESPAEIVAKTMFGGPRENEEAEKVVSYVVNASSYNPAADQFFTNYQNDIENINSSIRSEFKKDLKSPILEYLTISPEQAFSAPIYNNSYNKFVIAGSEMNFPGNVFANFPGNANKTNQALLKKSWPLDTKLKDIDARPWVWYWMMRAYTGCDITLEGSDAAEETGNRNFPKSWLERYIFASDILDPNDPSGFYAEAKKLANLPAEPDEESFLLGTVDGYDPSWEPADDGQGKIGWWHWFQRSPGLRRLVSIAHATRKSNSELSYRDLNKNGHQFNLAQAFMELTVAEATGLEYDRIKDIFPEMQDYFSNPATSVVFGAWHGTNGTVNVLNDNFKNIDKSPGSPLEAGLSSQDLINEFQGISKESQRWGEYDFYYPHFIVFEKFFRNPKSPLSADPETIIKSFSTDGEKVNKELYNSLNFVPESMIAPHQRSTADTQAKELKALYKEWEFLQDDPNYNPNILKYDLSFTEMSSKTAPGLGGENKTSEILNIFSNANSPADQISALADSLESINLERSLIHQNVSTPLQTNIESQLDGIRNVSKLIKGAVQPFEEKTYVEAETKTIIVPQDGGAEYEASDELYDQPHPESGIDEETGLEMTIDGHLIKYVDIPAKTLLGDSAPIAPNIVVDDSRISNEIYNFNFGADLSPDVKELIESIYSDSQGPNPSKMLDDYKNFYGGGQLDPLNFKAQIFSQLLTKKFNQKAQEYLPNIPEVTAGTLNIILKEFLAEEGYSALQYAYSTQMFAKLKASRLQDRGFMKRIWKKILKSPLTSNVDPRCQELLGEIGAASTQDLDETETDFFNLEDVKPKIIEFYEKSLCQDVYESNTTGQNSTRISLLEGMVKLVVKIYTLEMCLASVIAWDSFDIADVFKDNSMISIVIKNISEDFDIDFLSFFATDMLRKERSLTDVQLAKIRQGVDGAPKSSIEYLINQESESIATIIKGMFLNSFPLSTDLQVSLIKNSDTDYIEEFSAHVSSNTEQYPAYKYASIATGSSETIEYVSGVRIKDNIYSMGYGTGQKEPYVDAIEATSINGDFSAITRYNKKADIFGLRSDLPSRYKNNKNYFHSLPMNFYHALSADTEKFVDYNSETYDNWRTNTFKVNPNTARYDEFKAYNTILKDSLGFSDAFSHENNPESLHGNGLNEKLGNITFQPYVRVLDYGPDEQRPYSIDIYSAVEPNGDPCVGATIIDNNDINNYLDIIDEKITKFRKANMNVFNCEMYDYIPLSAWSYFYNNIFMKEVSKNDALSTLFNKFGLDPFFKKVSFGMRMTYSTANLKLSGVHDVLDDIFDVTNPNTPLKKVKSIIGRRPYDLSNNPADPDGENFEAAYNFSWETAVRRELQIPIVEIEKEIKFVANTQSFTVGESDLFPMSDLGSWFDTSPGSETMENLGILQFNPADLVKYPGENAKNLLKYLVNNPHQFFYKNLANDFLQEVKNSAEFKLMFDYLFPMRRYMAMATIFASDGLSKFISEPTDILDKTKSSLQTIIDNISNSTDYRHMPDPIANLLADRLMRSEAGTGAKEPDMTKEILKIVLRTPLLVLKGFVEVTDPAVITAKRIIDIANAIQAATLAAVKQSVATAKMIMQAGIDAARQIMQQLEMQISMGIGFAKSTMAMLPTVQTSTGPKKLSDYITMDTEPADIKSWIFEMDPTPPAELELAEGSDAYSQWTGFYEEFSKFKKLRDDYTKNAKKLEDLERKKKKFEAEAKVKIRKAENTMKDVFQSPYLLPGVWASMVPSVLPFGGGINPFPMPPPFISTVPGMIYLALLFIDAVEEKMHDDMQKTGDPNCEDQL